MNVCNSFLTLDPVFPGQIGSETGMDRQEEEFLSNADLTDQISVLAPDSVFLRQVVQIEFFPGLSSPVLFAAQAGQRWFFRV